MHRPWFKFYDEGVPATLALSIPNLTIPDFLEQTAQRYPKQVATVFMGARITYRALQRKVRRLAGALHQLGIRKGDRVAVILPNCPQMVISYYAILSLGGVTVLTNPLYVERELEHQWGDAGVKLVVTLDLLFPKVEAVCAKLGISPIVVTGIQDYLPAAKKLLLPLELRRQGKWVSVNYNDHVFPFRSLAERRQPKPPEVSLTLDDLACLQYTGGTTGLPKGAMLTHRNLVASVTQIRLFLLQGHQETTDKGIAILPLFHVYGMNAVMNLGVCIAATVVLLPRFEIKSLIDAIKTEKPTFFLGVPALYSAVLNYEGVDKVDLTSIKVCFSAAAPLPVEIIRQFEDRTGARIAEAYGMTEASSVTHVNPRFGQRKFGSVGVPIVGTDAKIVDVNDGQTELGPDQPGELWVKGPQVMQGYWNHPEETAEALTDGWLHTGDIAIMDEEGYFTIVDRKKDLIISSGYNIYPREVEEILFQHPKIELAAVIGLPNSLRGERVVAYIKLKEGQQATPGEIRSFCKEHLADYKVPRSIVFRDELPIALTGKVLRRILREEELARLKMNGEK